MERRLRAACRRWRLECRDEILCSAANRSPSYWFRFFGGACSRSECGAWTYYAWVHFTSPENVGK